jgi:putative DNA primase/helicase
MDFSTSLYSAGIDPADIDFSLIGVWQRVPTLDHPNKRNGAVKIFSGRPLHAWYTNHATSACGYHADDGGFISRPDFEVLRRARIARQVERDENQADACAGAFKAWCASNPADPAHHYLVAKRVQPHRIRQIGDYLLVPMYAEGRMWSHQTIAPDGSKRFLTGGRKRGTYFPIGGPPDSTLLLCEGFATGASLYEALNIATAVCFDAGNLVHAGVALRHKFPHVRFIYCADNDIRTLGNPGITRATEAAAKTNGTVAFPEFGLAALKEPYPTDWNDMSVRYGPEVVRQHFATVLS